MARQPPTTAYVEVQIDEDSISLTLISESGSSGAVIEDTERYTFEDLQSLSGEHDTLRLSRESANALETSAQSDTIEEILDEAEQLVEDEGNDLPEVGTVYTDENAPSWSVEDGVTVKEVLEGERADHYVIEGLNAGNIVHPESQHWSDETVATANPSYPDDDTVVLGRYVDGSKEYAFPASRLI